MGVGVVSARRPRPASAALLALSVKPVDNRKPGLTDEQWKAEQAAVQQGYLVRFLDDHLAAGEYERLNLAMLDPDSDLPVDTIGRVARAVARWGTGRTFAAVLTLSLSAAMVWRDLRTRMRGYGIADPMLLPSMHALLDEVEKMWRESSVTGNEAKDRAALRDLNKMLYWTGRTEEEIAAAEAAADDDTPPAWFGSTDDVEDTFDGLVRQLGAR